MYRGVMGEQVGCGRMIEEGWRKGPWTAEEDRLLIEHVKLHGEGRWNSVAMIAGLKRNGKSCRLRWVNYLRPDLKRGQITPQEESIILELHARWGNRWSTIARSLPGRTDNEIKNYWRTHFKKKEKPSLNDLGKLRANLLKRQKFQLEQQQQQQQQQLQLQQQLQQNELDMKRITSLLDESENKVAYLPQVRQLDRVEEQGLLSSVFNGCNYTSMQEVSNDDFMWDGLWNLDDVHVNFTAPAKAGLQSFTMPFP